MTYTTVMVGLSIDQPNEGRLEIAGQLAERFGAKVIGITAAEFSPPLYFTSGEQAQKLLDHGRAAIKSRLGELESEFRAAMQNRVTEVEWRCAEDFPSRYIVQQARASDIIVVGEAGRGTIADPFVQVNPSDLVMQTGRPLLVVPDACSWLDLRSVLIAWKDTAEARRAVADALPMLRKASDTTIVEIVEELADRATALSRVKDVAAWLSRHGVSASGQVPEECGEAGGLLEKIASEVGAGVVVAGAYGHSRLREWILGGVTRGLVNPSNRCSLLSRWFDLNQNRFGGAWLNSHSFPTEGRRLYTFIEQIVADHMTRDVKTVTRSVSLGELGDLFEKDDFNAYPVQEGSQVVGLVSKFDYLACFIFTPAHMIPRYEELMKRTVADVMTSEFIYVGGDTKLTRVLHLMVDHRLRSMPVIDSDQRLAGMISREDVMRALQRCVYDKA